MNDDFFDGDFDEMYFDEEEIDPETRIRKSIGKVISAIRFDVDEDLLDVLYLEFTDYSMLVLRCSRKKYESFIFVDEESFPQFIGAKILDVEVFEDDSEGDVFNADLECVFIKTNKGDFYINFEDGGKLVGETDDFDQYDEEHKRMKKNQDQALLGLIFICWIHN